MAFNDVIQQDGCGAVVLVDVSLDNFSTVAHRWSTVSFWAGSNHYEARLAEKGVGKLSRGFGNDNTSRAGTTSLLLDNTDAGVDWLVDRATVASQVFRARFKLTLAVYPAGDQASYQTKVLGTFKCIDWPSRDDRSVSVQLSDDTMGFFDQPLTSPTIRDWKDDAGSDVDNCPVHDDYQPAPNPDSDWDTPLPLVFGGGAWLNCFAAEVDHGVDAPGATASVGDMDGARAIVVCATTASAGVTSDDVRYLKAVYRQDAMLGTKEWSGAGKTIGIPKTFTIPPNAEFGAAGTYTIWEPQKTQTISKDGASWKLLWVKFNVDAYTSWWSLTHLSESKVGGQSTGNGNYAPVAYLVPQAPQATYSASRSARFAAFAYFQVKGFPFSARTVTNAEEQLGVDVIKDLISYYSKGSGSDFDSTRYASARAMSPVPVAGIIQPQRPVTTKFKYSKQLPPADALSYGQLRQALADICQSADLDLALTWEGKIAVYSSAFSFADITATRLAIDETRGSGVVEQIPSKGQRWAPYNRAYLIAPDGTPHGPFDNPDPNVDWGTTLERTFQNKWGPPFESSHPLYSNMVWLSHRSLESVVRPVVRFVTDREGLQLDLGDLFDFTWTRGGSAGPYTSAVFRVEGITLDLVNLAVGIEAVWVDDITDYPYLLDDETFTVRVSSGGGRTATVTDSSDTVDFSSGNLTSDGVVAGDILRLKDATQDPNVFTRFRDIRIASINSTTSLKLAGADLDFDSPGGTAVASWEIRRGFTTYPDSSSDPTNYPSDGDMYGKACSDSDVYSDSATVNRVG